MIRLYTKEEWNTLKTTTYGLPYSAPLWFEEHMDAHLPEAYPLIFGTGRPSKQPNDVVGAAWRAYAVRAYQGEQINNDTLFDMFRQAYVLLNAPIPSLDPAEDKLEDDSSETP